MLEKISASIDDGMLFIYGGLVVLFIKFCKHITGFLAKPFAWCALIFFKALSVEIEKKAKEWLNPIFEDLKKEFDSKIDELRKDINLYKGEKHSIEGELKQLKSAINDNEISREELKFFIKDD